MGNFGRRRCTHTDGVDGAYTSDGTMEQQQHGCSSLAWVQLVVVLEANKMVLSMDKRMDKRMTSAMVSPFVAWIDHIFIGGDRKSELMELLKDLINTHLSITSEKRRVVYHLPCALRTH